MKTQLLIPVFTLLISLQACDNKEDDNVFPDPPAYAVAGTGTTIKKMSPVAEIHPTEHFFVNHEGMAEHSVVEGQLVLDFGPDKTFDLAILAMESQNDTLRGIGLRAFPNFITFFYHPEPLQDLDTISNSLTWIRFNNAEINLLSNKFITADWSEPRYLAIKRYNARGQNDFVWIKLSIEDVNKAKIYSYLDTAY
jgi:hypothetical protein